MMPPGFPQNVKSFLMPPPKPATSCLNVNLVCGPALQLSILAIELRFRTAMQECKECNAKKKKESGMQETCISRGQWENVFAN